MLNKYPAVIAATLLAPLAWGTTYIVTTEFLPPDRPMLAALLRALPAGLILLAFVRTLPKGEWWWKASVLGVMNVGAFFALLFVGAYRLPGGLAAVVGALQPLIVLVLAAKLVGETVTALKVAAGVAGLGGVALLVLTPSAKLDSVGLVAAISGTVLMAGGVVLTKRWKSTESPLVMTAWQLVAGGLFLIPIAAIEGFPTEAFTLRNIGGYVWLGTFGTMIAYFVWFRGIARLPVGVVVFLQLLTSVVAAVIGWLVLGETFTLAQIIGAALVLGAIVAVTTARRPAQPEVAR